MASRWFCTIRCHGHESKASPASCPNCHAQLPSLLAIGADPALTPITPKPQTLEEVRDLARQGLKGVCAVYPHWERIGQTLRQAMVMTGCGDLAHVGPAILA